ncbi:MAG: RNA polymerase sigma factor [Chloroflexota bacterium]|nr:RNA polymerase sigma factor [Chloroflexota bacterium]
MVPEEEALVNRARAGETAAFNRLVELTQGVVYNVCLRTLGEAEAAADATQEAFFAAYRSLNSHRGGSFRAWLLRIAVNQCYDLLRKRKRQPAEPMDAEALEVVDPEPRPDQVALRAETARAVERAIGQLPLEQRLCVILVDAQGLDYQEAARALNVNLGTVKSRLSRARAELRELIPEEFRPRGGG